jgi:hypothetical protein
MLKRIDLHELHVVDGLGGSGDPLRGFLVHRLLILFGEAHQRVPHHLQAEQDDAIDKALPPRDVAQAPNQKEEAIKLEVDSLHEYRVFDDL